MSDDIIPENSAATIDETGRVRTDTSVLPLVQDAQVDEIVASERDQLPQEHSKNDGMPGTPRRIQP